MTFLLFGLILPNGGTLTSRVCTVSRLGNLCGYKDQDTHKYVMNSTSENDYGRTLGIASSIYVVSLPRRSDRRARMDKLKTFISVDWAYFDALDKRDDLIDNVMRFVKGNRGTNQNSTFAWPEQVDERAVAALFSDINATSVTPEVYEDPKPDNLFCAIGDNTIPSYKDVASAPFHMILSRGMIACWYSHLRLLWHIFLETQHISSGKPWDGKEGVAIVFEDDVDVEEDLKQRLNDMWSDLPRFWDIVMLGALQSLCTTTY